MGLTVLSSPTPTASSTWFSTKLHSYRGRQGADVAMLVRRVRDRLCPEKAPVRIGTSLATAPPSQS